jgi:hypothetical protein
MKVGLLCVLALAAPACSSDSSSADAPTSGGADAAASSADAGVAKTFTVTLAVANEMPPCSGAGSGATGSGTITISGDGSTLTVNTVTFSGLSGAATMAHIHAGASTLASGPVVLSLGTNPTSPITNKVFTSSDYVAASGAPATFAAFIASVKAGNGAYVNVHTSACGNGEIRGELIAQ